MCAHKPVFGSRYPTREAVLDGQTRFYANPWGPTYTCRERALSWATHYCLKTTAPVSPLSLFAEGIGRALDWLSSHTSFRASTRTENAGGFSFEELGGNTRIRREIFHRFETRTNVQQQLLPSRGTTMQGRLRNANKRLAASRKARRTHLDLLGGGVHGRRGGIDGGSLDPFGLGHGSVDGGGLGFLGRVDRGRRLDRRFLHLDGGVGGGSVDGGSVDGDLLCLRFLFGGGSCFLLGRLLSGDGVGGHGGRRGDLLLEGGAGGERTQERRRRNREAIEGPGAGSFEKVRCWAKTPAVYSATGRAVGEGDRVSEKRPRQQQKRWWANEGDRSLLAGLRDVGGNEKKKKNAARGREAGAAGSVVSDRSSLGIRQTHQHEESKATGDK